jgi:hypothetical protein
MRLIWQWVRLIVAGILENRIHSLHGYEPESHYSIRALISQLSEAVPPPLDGYRRADLWHHVPHWLFRALHRYIPDDDHLPPAEQALRAHLVAAALEFCELHCVCNVAVVGYARRVELERVAAALAAESDYAPPPVVIEALEDMREAA